ncbi:MAG: tail fiber domain-containing protein [Bacteroidetes bacterium]|nr:tail fiber domain-containing protein [Bacteroidota bacterium]
MNFKNLTLSAFAILIVVQVNAQVGIGTTTPNSTLQVMGSFSTNYRAFSTNSAAAATDQVLVFTGSSATTLTLPTAVGITGRSYLIKNTGTGILTVATTAAQTIDALTTWILDQQNQTVVVVSNGSNWYIGAQGLPGGSGTYWSLGGNNVTAIKTLGTTSNYDLPFITNNTEKMRLTSTGRLGIGTSTFDGTNPEKLLVDAGATTSYNVISGKGSINNYLQLNIQNKSSGTSASSDVVATADNGNESVNYIDMGINSSGYTNTSAPILTGANNAYLYAAGNDFMIGNASSGRFLSFFTGGYATSNERMRITGSGLVGIGNTSPTEKLQVEGNIRLSGLNRAIFFDSDSDPYSGIKNISRSGEVNELMLFSGNDVADPAGADRIRLASNEIHFATTASATSINSGDPTSQYGNTTTVPTRMYINQNGNVAIGSTTFNATKPEKLLVDAGTTTSYNVITGKGSIDSYLQLNIQNASNGSSASSDIVATADNGSETTNYVNLGINSSGYTSSGITGGANNAYLYSTGNDFIIGNSTDDKSLIFYTSTGGTSTERMRITNLGLIPGQDNSYSLGNSTKRWTAVWAVNGTIQTSDARLKKNIQPLNYGLNELMQLKPVSYNWIDNSMPGKKIGLIAQDVKKIVPEVIIGDESKETLGMNYAEMVPVLINAIKELNTEVSTLEQLIRKAKRNK